MNRTPSAETWVDRAIRYYNNECSKINRPLRQRTIRKNEYEMLINRYSPTHQYRLIWELLWNVGMRSIEVCWLHRNNFNEDFTILEYKIAKPKHEKIKDEEVKVYKSRAISIPNNLAVRIAKYWNGISRISPYGYLFPSYTKTRHEHYQFYINPKSLNKELDRYRKIFGGRWLEETPEGDHIIMPRSFRISWITRFGEASKDIFKTAKAIGHDDPRTTATYFDPVSIEDIRSFQRNNEIITGNTFISHDQRLLTDYENNIITRMII